MCGIFLIIYWYTHRIVAYTLEILYPCMYLCYKLDPDHVLKGVGIVVSFCYSTLLLLNIFWAYQISNMVYLKVFKNVEKFKFE